MNMFPRVTLFWALVVALTIAILIVSHAPGFGQNTTDSTAQTCGVRKVCVNTGGDHPFALPNNDNCMIVDDPCPF